MNLIIDSLVEYIKSKLYKACYFENIGIFGGYIRVDSYTSAKVKFLFIKPSELMEEDDYLLDISDPELFKTIDNILKSCDI